jgi:hypothetical protein
LDTIHRKLAADTALSKELPFNLSRKGEKESRQYGMLLNYMGPDSDTITVLLQHHDDWINNPWRFWQGPTSPDLSHLAPQAQIVGRYMYMSRSDT